MYKIPDLAPYLLAQGVDPKLPNKKMHIKAIAENLSLFYYEEKLLFVLLIDGDNFILYDINHNIIYKRPGEIWNGFLENYGFNYKLTSYEETYKINGTRRAAEAAIAAESRENRLCS